MSRPKEYKPGNARDDAAVLKEKAEKLEAMVRQFSGDGKPVLVESSVYTPEGLRISCKNGEQARRLLTLVKLLTPEIMHVLYELHDHVVLLKNPPTWPNALPKPDDNRSPGPGAI
jgi:hypothetical protein